MKKALIFLLLIIGSVSYAQLTGPITDRPAATSLSNTDLFYVVQGANDKKLTYQVLKSELFDFGDEVTFGDIVLFADTIYFTSKTAGIYRDVDTLMFFDPTGVYKLYELADTGSGGGGTGTGVVDTAGGQANTYVAYWVDGNTLDGEAAFAYNATDDELTVSNVITTEELYLSQFDTDVADTVALIFYKMTGLVDTATLVDAAAGWVIELVPYDDFYNHCLSVKSLPLPYPDLGTKEAHGQDRHKINAKYAYYQIEFELERLHRYLKETKDYDKFLKKEIDSMREDIDIIEDNNSFLQRRIAVLSGALVLLIIGFIYQQVQINKLRKNA